jgi:hypothetical protein
LGIGRNCGTTLIYAAAGKHFPKGIFSSSFWGTQLVIFKESTKTLIPAKIITKGVK